MCQLGGSWAEKDLGILVDTTVKMSHQRAFAPKASDVTGFPSKIIPSCIISSNRVSEVILPLYSALERPHLECSVHCWLHERHGQTGESPTKGHEDDQRTGAFLRRETLAQVAQEGDGVSLLGDNQKMPVHSPGELASSVPG